MAEKKNGGRSVAAAPLRLDEGASHFGSRVIDPEAIEAARCEPPEERFVRDLLASPDRHGMWVSLPTAPMGSVKAKATARAWSRRHVVDGRAVKLDAVALPDETSGTRNRWIVAVRYTPSRTDRAGARTPAAADPSPRTQPPTPAPMPAPAPLFGQTETRESRGPVIA